MAAAFFDWKKDRVTKDEPSETVTSAEVTIDRVEQASEAYMNCVRLRRHRQVQIFEAVFMG
jgi:hypothetical protein